MSLLKSLIALLPLLPLLSASPSTSNPNRYSYKEILEAVSVQKAYPGHTTTSAVEDHHRIPSYVDPSLGKDFDETTPGSQAVYLHEMVNGAATKTGDGDGKKKQPQPQPSPFPPWGSTGAYWGIKTFAHLQPVRCTTEDSDVLYDVAILGAPFDTATSYRPGARFGPAGIRNGAQFMGGFNRLMNVNPYQELRMVDCGDSRMTFYSNDRALATLEADYKDLLARPVYTNYTGTQSITKDGKFIPRIVMLGGDHTIVLPALRALYPYYGKITVVHFDSHADSRHPGADAILTHGDYFWYANQEGILANNSIHAGIRVQYDDVNDKEVGFEVIEAHVIEDIGYKGVVEKIKERVGDSPIYLTIDIDTLDPAFAGATGTPVIGGWTTLQMKKILHGMKDLKIIGADVVEVAPAYDTQAEITQLAGAGIVNEILSMMALQPLIAP